MAFCFARNDLTQAPGLAGCHTDENSPRIKNFPRPGERVCCEGKPRHRGLEAWQKRRQFRPARAVSQGNELPRPRLGSSFPKATTRSPVKPFETGLCASIASLVLIGSDGFKCMLLGGDITLMAIDSNLTAWLLLVCCHFFCESGRAAVKGAPCGIALRYSGKPSDLGTKRTWQRPRFSVNVAGSATSSFCFKIPHVIAAFTAPTPKLARYSAAWRTRRWNAFLPGTGCFVRLPSCARHPTPTVRRLPHPL